MSDSRPASVIKLGKRHRHDMGDVKALADSIREIGLLHPVVIAPDNTLIAGERRLAAVKSLGWDEVPVTVAPLDDIVKGEFAENAIRKDFLPSEIEAIRRAMAPKVATPHGGDRSKRESFALADKEPGKTADKIGAFAGVSGRTVEKIAAVVEAAEQEPERYAPLVQEMDRTGKVDGAYKKLKKAKKEQEIVKAAAAVPDASERYELHHAACIEALKLDAGSVDIVVTDPPYPAEYLHLFGGLGQVGAHVLKPGGVALVMVGQTYLPDIIASLGKHLTYHWTIAYLTPGGQAVQQFPCKVNAFWKPVLVYRKGDYAGDWFGDVARSDTNDNDKSHHHWGQSASGMRDLMKRFVRPGNVVIDPFLGGGTTAVVALELGARFIGYDIDNEALVTTRARIGEVHAAVVA